MSLGPPPSASTLEVRHQVSRHASVVPRCLWTLLLQEPSTQPRVTCSSCCHRPPAEQCPRGARRGPREIPALNQRMSKDLPSRGIWRTSHSASSDKRGHSSSSRWRTAPGSWWRTPGRYIHRTARKRRWFSRGLGFPAGRGCGESRLRFSAFVQATAVRRFSQEQLRHGTVLRAVRAPGFAGSVPSPAAGLTPSRVILHTAKPKFAAVPSGTAPEQQSQCAKACSWWAERLDILLQPQERRWGSRAGGRCIPPASQGKWLSCALPSQPRCSPCSAHQPQPCP